jgi:uncharacterized protein YciI
VFILELTFIAPLERVDAVAGDHMAWLKKQYEAGLFIASGRKEPRDGGVIVAVGGSRADFERLVATDPFSVSGVAEYRIVEFLATTTAPPLAVYREEPRPA